MPERSAGAVRPRARWRWRVGAGGTYYVLDAAGGVHAFGPGAFHGSLPGRGIPTKVVDLAVHRGGWYTVLDASAKVHQFGRGTIFGSLGERGIRAKPIALAAS